MKRALALAAKDARALHCRRALGQALAGNPMFTSKSKAA